MALFPRSMVALTCAEVIGRRIIGGPIHGANDIAEHLLAPVVFADLPLVTAAGAHLTIDLLDTQIGQAWRALRRALTPALVIIVLATIAWLFGAHGLNTSRSPKVNAALRGPRAPLHFLMALSAGRSALAGTILTGPMVDRAEPHQEDAR
ncbi:MAG: TRAP-type C4-dicarboxylate transport system permease small subunit [Paracoccaceae bacterium]|jgi:TRAP-type C4-dicarboxylate transport system permease small subunit